MLRFQMFSEKSTTMVTLFRHLRKSELMVKVSKYSIKSEAVILMQFWRVLNVLQKKTYTWDSFEIKLQDYSLKLLLKKVLVQVFSYEIAKYSRAPFCKTRPGDCFCKISFCLSRQPQPPNVTIKLVFCVLL